MNFLRRYSPYLLLIVFLVSGGLLWWYRDDIRDWVVLRGYDPPAPIARLAADTAMSSYGQRLFYVNKPSLDDKVALNQHCEGLAEEAAVLGCFRGDRQGIYIYDITDPRLSGVEQVTAAHEMLHQAYERLDNTQKKRIDSLLEDYYRTKLTDQSVKDKMEIYKKTEPNDLANEMHSIFGTEIKDLPSELEEHYSQYFADRQKVVTYRTQSQAEFDKYRNQIATYDQRLAELKPQIEANEQDLTAQVAAIKAKKAQMESDLAAGNVAAYNAAVAPYNAMVKAYNSDLSATNRLIEEHNKLVKERNEIAVQVKSLNEALNSSLTPQ
jgi:hypothetical protein